MFCEKCGNEIKADDKFCIKCGISLGGESAGTQQKKSPLNDKWWHRLLKVLYIIAYLPLLGTIPIVWSLNAPQYDSYYGTYGAGSNSGAFWYSLLTLVIYLVTLRLIKIAVLYVALGQKPDWKQQFKRVF